MAKEVGVYDARYHANQSNFATGEISRSVSARVDLEKYPYSLTRAKNVYIRPYGQVSKRSGTIFCGETKYNDRSTIIKQFNRDSDSAFLLEIGDRYVRVWFNGVYQGIELSSPWVESDLENLRFSQSVDVMFVCSGTQPVYTISRYSDTEWVIEKYKFSIQPFLPVNDDASNKVSISYTGGGSQSSKYSTPGSYGFTAPISATYTIQVAGAGGYGWPAPASPIAYGHAKGGSGAIFSSSVYMAEGTVASVIVGQGGQGFSTSEAGTNSDGDRLYNYTGSNGSQSSVSVGTTSTVAGSGTGGNLKSTSPTILTSRGSQGTAGTNSGNGQGGQGGNAWSSWAGTNGGNGWVTISWQTSSTAGNKVTSTKDLFTQGMVGSQIKIVHDIPQYEIIDGRNSGETGSRTSMVILCGKSWTFLTTGNWAGTASIEISNDQGTTWRTLNTYISISAGDFNASTNGVIEDDPIYIRITVNLTATSGSSFTLTSMPYSHNGIIEIVSVTDSKNAIFNSVKQVAMSDATDLWYLSAWSYDFGFPRVVTFFQDRLFLAANNKKTFTFWMSMTSDYVNFDEIIKDGTLTDDSAIQADLISRDVYEIRHVMSAQDLVIFTTGNEWILSGSDVATPTNINPKVQTGNGSSKVPPQFINNKSIYVQRRSSSISDIGYSYYADGYVSEDLTILAKHLTEHFKITSSSYSHEPDSIIYFTRDDGVILCLTYKPDQKIFAWSRLYTDGRFKYVESTYTDNEDIIYAIVEREINGEKKQYLEYFASDSDSDKSIDYTMVDCSVRYNFAEGFERNILSGLSHLKGKMVQVQGDGYVFAEKDVFVVSDEGTITLPTKVSRAVVGLAIYSEIEQPAFNSDDSRGSLQGRSKTISTAILILENSYGGRISTDFEQTMDPIIYNITNPFKDFDLFTGNMHATPPINYDEFGKVCISHNTPYPFNLSSIVRVLGVSKP